MVMMVKKEKCLGFCASIEHAKYMADEFNKRGYKSVCLYWRRFSLINESILYKEIRR